MKKINFNSIILLTRLSRFSVSTYITIQLAAVMRRKNWRFLLLPYPQQLRS